MKAQDVQIVQAGADQQHVLAQLMELYAYDLSEIFNLDVKDSGRYDHEHLHQYWGEPNRLPFLIWVDQKLAGFALIQKISPTESGPDVWDVAEFFIMRKFRRMGAGRTAAHWIWSKFPGPWQVRVLATNKNANDFWKDAIAGLTNTTATPSKKSINGKEWLVFRFESYA